MRGSKPENPGVVDAAVDYILRNYHRPISLFMVAEETGVSESYLSGLFHRKTGESYVKYLTRTRMEAAAWYLDNCPGMTVSEIAEKTGYMAVKHFLYVFKKRFGVTPTEYRRRKKAENSGPPETLRLDPARSGSPAGTPEFIRKSGFIPRPAEPQVKEP
jgi:AraC-like DNA-binding protein